MKSARQAQVVELKYFGGLSVEQIASTLDVAPRSVKRGTWSLARMFLFYRELNPGAMLPEADSGDEPDGRER